MVTVLGFSQFIDYGLVTGLNLVMVFDHLVSNEI
jgi:hypothetical protein